MATEKQLAANQQNSLLSTGPVTPEGKAVSSHNAVKTGLTGQTVLLKTDDVEAYKKHVQRITDKCQPANDDERALAQDLADTEWRLLRIAPLEAGILALGRLELAPQFTAEPDQALRDAMLEAKVFLVYRRDLNNLSLQQTRLTKRRLDVKTELKEIQATRKHLANRQAQNAALYYEDAIIEGWDMDLTDFGFDFTLEDMFDWLARSKATNGRDVHRDVTAKVYKEEFRAEYEEHFGAK